MHTETTVIDASFLPIVLDFRDVLEKISDDEFESFCRHNPDLQIELTEQGELVITPPTGGKTGNRNFSLNGYFYNWVEQDRNGIGFDSSTVFRLPNGAKRSPDLAWITNDRWEKLTDEEQEKFPLLCPDFIVELRSRTDSLSDLRTKMEEYVENGAKLGWLIDPFQRKIYIYRQDQAVTVLDKPTTISGAPLLQNFILPMKKIWA